MLAHSIGIVPVMRGLRCIFNFWRELSIPHSAGKVPSKFVRGTSKCVRLWASFDVPIQPGNVPENKLSPIDKYQMLPKFPSSLGIVPVNTLDCSPTSFNAVRLSSKMSISKLTRLPSVSGKLEFKPFQPNTIDVRLTKLPISEGKGPSKLFSKRVNCSSPVAFPTSAGMLPSKKLDASRSSLNCRMLKMSLGMLPVKRFASKIKVSISIPRPNCFGKDPVMPEFFKFKCFNVLRFSKALGIDPPSPALFDRSSTLRALSCPSSDGIPPL
mmetsp:Transcript_24585/g.44351  ORF Transcript_24585/g.44351 Transcript_24585/m.44351 type:complete len:269 (+) Transcript_24585:372-1178(+)